VEKQEIISSGILEMYVIGAASVDETAQVEKWSTQYSEIQTEIKSIENAFEAYAFTNAVAPSVSVKASILSSITSTNTNFSATTGAKVVSIFPLLKLVAASAILLLVGSVILNVMFYNQYKTANAKYEEGQQQIASLNAHVTDVDKDLSIVQNRYSLPVSLKGLEAAPEAGAKIFWIKNTGEVYVDPTNLPIAPSGKQYQLWAIVDGKPVDGGLINLKERKKYNFQKMKSFGKAQAFAITLENTGGNPQPKGTMYVMGEI
jgi:anti-sigma-K factor RskA